MKEKGWFRNMDQRLSLSVAVSGKHTGAMGRGENVAYVEMFHNWLKEKHGMNRRRENG